MHSGQRQTEGIQLYGAYDRAGGKWAEQSLLYNKAAAPGNSQIFMVKPKSVEHALRTLTLYCWNYGARKAMWEIAGRRLESAPTNADFIDMLAAYIKI